MIMTCWISSVWRKGSTLIRTTLDNCLVIMVKNNATSTKTEGYIAKLQNCQIKLNSLHHLGEIVLLPPFPVTFTRLGSKFGFVHSINSEHGSKCIKLVHNN